MNTINKTIIILYALGLIVSCKKGEWYDVKSDRSLAIPSTLKDMQALMDNSLVMNIFTPGLGEVASDGHYVSDVKASTLIGTQRNAYTWSYEQRYEKVSDWTQTSNGSYVRIYYSNLVLDGLQKIKPNDPEDQTQLNDIKGQALVHRAHAFYELAQVFAPPYDATNSGTKLGIPLRLESDINISSKRASVSQTYNQIVNDLLEAKDLLPESPLYKTRPSKQAVYALLARVYLNMENYERASTYASLALTSYNVLMDYKTLNVIGTTNPIVNYNPEIIFYTSMTPNTNTIGFANLLIDKVLYDSYNSNDLRKNVFFNFNPNTNLVSYKGTYCGRGFNSCFTGLATDEIYLIRAECYARIGKITEAMADLNTLLKTRWSGTYTSITAVDKDDALKMIMEERRKELVLRGLRWSDLRRLNRDSRFAVTLTRTIAGQTYILEPNSYKYTFPIPDDIIEMTGMEQNEGWNIH